MSYFGETLPETRCGSVGGYDKRERGEHTAACLRLPECICGAENELEEDQRADERSAFLRSLLISASAAMLPKERSGE